MQNGSIPATLEEQIQRLVDLGFHKAAGLDSASFTTSAARLGEAFTREAKHSMDAPPVLVASSRLVTAAKLIEAIDRHDGKPDTLIHAEEHARYGEIEGVELPDAAFYLLIGFDREPETRNLSPENAKDRIAEAGRTPLTIDEGLAIFAQWPECVWANDGISLAASSRGDRRVPAIWISKKQPKLGWCFAGTPHTWLATASCAARVID